jgi:hypothetical protein
MNDPVTAIIVAIVPGMLVDTRDAGIVIVNETVIVSVIEIDPETVTVVTEMNDVDGVVLVHVVQMVDL